MDGVNFIYLSVIDEASEQIFPACIFNDWGISKTFLIIYKNQEVELDDQFNFKLSVIVDAQNVCKKNRKDIFYDKNIHCFSFIGH